MADRHGIAVPIGWIRRSAALPATWGIWNVLPSRASAVRRERRPTGITRKIGDHAVEKGKARWTWIAATRNLTPIAGECKGESVRYLEVN
jgi:hypothetical protein